MTKNFGSSFWAALPPAFDISGLLPPREEDDENQILEEVDENQGPASPYSLRSDLDLVTLPPPVAPPHLPSPRKKESEPTAPENGNSRGRSTSTPPTKRDAKKIERGRTREVSSQSPTRLRTEAPSLSPNQKITTTTTMVPPKQLPPRYAASPLRERAYGVLSNISQAIPTKPILTKRAYGQKDSIDRNNDDSTDSGGDGRGRNERRASLGGDSRRRNGSKTRALNIPKFSSLRKEGTIMEKLFGDVRRDQQLLDENGDPLNLSKHPSNSLPSLEGANSSPDHAPMTPRAQRQLTKVRFPRRLMTSSILHSDPTNLWIVVIDSTGSPGNVPVATSALRAFSYYTQEEAKAAAYAYSPPQPVPFDQQLTCQLCRAKFAVFRRPAHCRNCGICICSNSACRTSWPADRVPNTYQKDHSGNDVPRRINICTDCHCLAEQFRQSLLEGNEEEALDLYETGNVNLRCPLGKDKNDPNGNHEVMFPIHAAAKGKNLTLLKWLVDVHFCPIFMTRTGNGSRKKSSGGSCDGRSASEPGMPLLTSTGRSLLQIALANQQTEMLRYLVVDKKMNPLECPDIVKDLHIKLVLENLNLALRQIPNNTNDDDSLNPDNPQLVKRSHSDLPERMTGRSKANDNIIFISNAHSPPAMTLSEKFHAFNQKQPTNKNPYKDEDEVEEEDDQSVESDDVTVTTINDACIICHEKSIDCVMTPCGHQLCCRSCSTKLSVCPICNTRCAVLPIYRP